MPSSPRPRGRRSAEEARATRARIIESAGALFADNGYITSSMRDIGERAAVTTGAVYRHFKSKAELLAEAIEVLTTDRLEAGLLGSSRPVNHVEALTGQALRVRRRRALRALLVQGAAAARTDDETRTRLRAQQRAHIDAWTAAYGTNRARNGIDPTVDLEAVVLYTWAAELGLGVLESIGIEPRTAKAWADVQNRFARALRLPPEQPTAD